MKPFFMPFGLAAGKIVLMVPEYDKTKYPLGMRSYPVYHPEHIFLTYTRHEYPVANNPIHHIAFFELEVEQPDDFYRKYPKRKELFRILHPRVAPDLEDIELFTGEFRDRNEIYYVPLNKELFEDHDWQEWLIELTNWANIVQKSVVVHATEDIPMLSDFKFLYHIPNVFIYQSHTDWGILPGIISSGEKFEGL
ncbi:hypothetical protein LCGC14_0266970 [marine sediment metagenome]|uniref:Uncharacterized protein n=1 Tax=marine sediment metagenome TaxID=412755 RepID=A0A0F9WKI3_9ZZZZ